MFTARWMRVSAFSVTSAKRECAEHETWWCNVAVDCKNVDLTPFTPYMEKFGGYPLQRGKLLVDLSYDIAQRKLNASNHVIVADGAEHKARITKAPRPRICR